MRHFESCPLYGRTLSTLSRVLGVLALSVAVAGVLSLPATSWAKKPPKSTNAAVAALPAAPPAATAESLAATAQVACTPKKVLIVGDSFAVGLGMTLEQSLKPRGPVALASRGKVSSGLNTPKFYDWENALTDFLTTEKPDALVVMLGGNDAKNGKGTPEWSKDFQAKAARFLSIAAGRGVSIIWVGLPPMRDKTFSQKAWTANEAMRAACVTAKGCRFIDSWDLFADKAGNFSAKKPLGGKAVSLRGKDGVHFSAAGCKLLTDRVATGLTTAP
nr:GDSL-type esterase/lipase family protein [Solidesulfovibrio aerotolerans]